MSLSNNKAEQEESTIVGGFFRFIGELFYGFANMKPEDEAMPLHRFINYFPILEQFSFETGSKDFEKSLRNMYEQTRQILENKDLWEQSQREYQSLFFAPVVPVPLWESIYLSQQKSMFTEETTAVREWYRRFDLEISTVGYEAEDHIAFEFFFCGWLFDKTTLNASEKIMPKEIIEDEIMSKEVIEDDSSIHDFDEFIHEHIGRWGVKCLSSLEKNSSDPFWIASFSTAKNFLEIMINEELLIMQED